MIKYQEKLSHYSENDKRRVLLTLESIEGAISQLIGWNEWVRSSDDYYDTQTGMQLLAANCTLITAIGEGVNRVNRVMPEFLQSNFPDVPWYAIVGMRNHIAHGYFELDADLVYEAVSIDIPPLLNTIQAAIQFLSK